MLDRAVASELAHVFCNVIPSQTDRYEGARDYYLMPLAIVDVGVGRCILGALAKGLENNIHLLVGIVVGGAFGTCVCVRVCVSVRLCARVCVRVCALCVLCICVRVSCEDNAREYTWAKRELSSMPVQTPGLGENSQDRCPSVPSSLTRTTRPWEPTLIHDGRTRVDHKRPSAR